MAVFLGWLALAGAARTQELPAWLVEERVPPPPPLGVSDRAGLFSRDTEALQRISAGFAKLEADHGFRLYLVLEPVMIRGTPPELAARLQLAWLPQGNGLVVVYEVDSGLMGVGRDVDDGADLGSDGRVPSYEMMEVIAKVRAATDSDLPAAAYVETLAAALVSEFDGYFARREAPSSPGRSLRIGLITAGTLATLALAALGMAWMLRRAGSDGPRSFRFPEVEVPERLGAPAGGGDVTSRRFRPDEPDVRR